MSEMPISPLRRRMLEDMSVRRFVPDTQREYIRVVKRLATFLGRSPDSATSEELRAFQLHLTETGVQPPTINATVTALRFFFKVTLDRPETTRHLVFVYEPRKLPRVLSPEEVLRLLEAAPGPKHKAALSVAYGPGLRAMEVVAPKVCDIDSKRMMLRVDQGKGRKDRHAMLSPQLLELLRDWWRIAQHLQVHQLCRRHHVVVQIRHDQKRSDDDQGDDQHTERQRHHVVGVVRPRGDMQEEHQVDAHLRDREDRQAERDTAGPEQ
jgi:integrase/recombinase XerD